MKFIALVDALHVVHRLNFYVKDVGLLDSALARPASEMFGVEAYPAFELKAAALHQSLVTYHALLDGNKRLAWLLLNVFVELNGFELVMTADEGFDFTLGVAEGRHDLAAAASIIGGHLRPLD